MKYTTEEYQSRLHLRNSAKEFVVILKSVNDLNESQLEKLRSYNNLLDFMVDLGFYSDGNVPEHFEKLLKFSDLFFFEVERYKTVGKLVISSEAQTRIIGGLISFQNFIEVNRPVLDSMERKRCMQTAFDYAPSDNKKYNK